jgi:integrase
MATTNLIRGMGTFFKECEHPESKWSRCPHEYKIRYRNAAGRQTEEGGFSDQTKAKARLAEVYQARKHSPLSQRKAERIQKYGSMQFSEYVADWKKGQRHLNPSSLAHLDSLLTHHLLPAIGSRRMGTFDALHRQAALQIAAHPEGLAFAKPDGLPLRPQWVLDQLRKRTSEVDLPTIGLHDLRHTAASIMIALGIPIAVVSKTPRNTTHAITVNL